MLAKDLITDEVPPLKLNDPVSKALGWMEEFRLMHIPVVDKGAFMGLLSDAEIYDLTDEKIKIGELSESFIKAAVNQKQHGFDVLKIISNFNLSAVAVLDDDMKYVGVITTAQLLDKIAEMPFVHEPGGIIVLELAINDYSLAQIAQIVEGNDAKILSCYITSNIDSNKIELTVKINRDDLSGVIQTFNRYNYTIKASFHRGDYDQDLRRRYDEFMHFLNL